MFHLQPNERNKVTLDGGIFPIPILTKKQEFLRIVVTKMNLSTTIFSYLNRSLLLLFCSMSFNALTPDIDVQRNSLRVLNLSETALTTNFNMAERFQRFVPLSTQAQYTITICADIPDNTNADRTHVGQQPGHVFIILEKEDSITPGKLIVQVFGFYPVSQHSSLFAGDVSCKILDNSNREYNASISKKISAPVFQSLLEKSKQLAKRKYNLRRFNCYDYVVEIFNSIEGIEKLPVTHVRLPYLLGRAGSPCGLYLDLKKLKDKRSAWAPYIQFGIFTAPQSTIVQDL